ncbi:unnamed protein product [Microthlaspi erraticum]|uniref:Gnk2-homologous domain-containing protein n=1 Tax=Microthlaspi erraticum TaxID=1685480 RepID=A0A6D2IRH9_9BRAS|nr:unnamed protein product [Microthlaspi erraticum]
MYSSYSRTNHLVLVHILAIELILIRSVSSLNLTNAYLHHKCLPSEGTYKAGSKYEKDLNIITRRLSAYSFPDGFRHISYGDAPNSVSVIFQCRGDSYGSFCRSCFSTALAGVMPVDLYL